MGPLMVIFEVCRAMGEYLHGLIDAKVRLIIYYRNIKTAINSLNPSN